MVSKCLEGCQFGSITKMAAPGRLSTTALADTTAKRASSGPSLKVRKAYDGSASLEAALDYRPNVAVLDIGLPGLDGYQLATRIREQAALQNVVLVALTGYEDELARKRSLGAGFDHHLTKPAHIEKLKEILASVS